jgi:hypothetical protein
MSAVNDSSSSRVFKDLRCVGLGWLITLQALLGYRGQYLLDAFHAFAAT